MGRGAQAPAKELLCPHCLGVPVEAPASGAAFMTLVIVGLSRGRVTPFGIQPLHSFLNRAAEGPQVFFLLLSHAHTLSQDFYILPIPSTTCAERFQQPLL